MRLQYRWICALAIGVTIAAPTSAESVRAENGTRSAASTAGTSVLAFPGAEGFGASSVGGRGGLVYEVTNTNDSGSGSLRNCIEASGPRICIFKTGGLISLSSPLTIRNPYITIAGQTAPGGGVTVKLGASTEAFSTKTHDVIIRYVTVRPGPGGENHGNQIAANGVELYNIMIDHNTYSWGVDSDIETWYRVRAATIQWTLISEGLNCSTHSKGCHSKGLMIGGYAGSEAKTTIGSENISILHNLMAHNADRNPLMQMCGIAQVVNNVTYDPAYTFSHQQLNCPLGASYINWIGNYHKKGPSSTSNTDLKIIPADSGTWYPGKVYLQGNIGPSRTSDSQPQTNWVSIGSGGSSSIIVTTPAVAPAVTTTDALTAYRDVLADVGNNRGLNCDGTWFSRRDAIDTRIVNDVTNSTGRIIDDPSQVGGWVTPASGTPCQDSDHDGMPNVWETKHGLNPSDPSDGATDVNGDGYTNLEDYLNGAPSTPPGSVTIAGNVGLAGATLSYVDGTLKTATADPIGNYSFVVPYAWSGTVTPSATGYHFWPFSKTYSSVAADQGSQDYASLAPLPTDRGWTLPPDGVNVCPDTQVGLHLILSDLMRREDGSFDASTIHLILDGIDVTPAAISMVPDLNPAVSASILYTPPTLLASGLHLAWLTYPAARGAASGAWMFTADASACPSTVLTMPDPVVPVFPQRGESNPGQRP